MTAVAAPSTVNAYALFHDIGLASTGGASHRGHRHRALIRPYEGLDRHSRDELEAVEAPDLLVGHADAHEKVDLAGALILDHVGGDSIDAAVELGGGALVEAGKPQRGLLIELDLIN